MNGNHSFRDWLFEYSESSFLRSQMGMLVWSATWSATAYNAKCCPQEEANYLKSLQSVWHMAQSDCANNSHLEQTTFSFSLIKHVCIEWCRNHFSFSHKFTIKMALLTQLFKKSPAALRLLLKHNNKKNSLRPSAHLT